MSIQIIQGINKRKIKFSKYENTVRIPMEYTYYGKVIEGYIDIVIIDKKTINIRGERGLIINPIVSNSIKITLDKD